MSDISSNIMCNIEAMNLTKLSKNELLVKCEELGIKKCKSKNKSELIQLINNVNPNPKPKPKFEFIIESGPVVVDNIDFSLKG